MFSKIEIENFLARPGDIRGAAFQSIASYILMKKGDDGLKKVEEQMKKWGVAGFEYKNIKSVAWYPIGWGALFVLSAMEVFNWDEQEIRKMGESAPKFSFVLKMFFNLFPDIEKLAQQIPIFWKKNYTVGNIEVAEVDKKGKKMLLKYNDFSYHPALCKYLEGYMEKALQFARPAGSIIKVKEIKCSLKDKTPYELFQVDWT